jgi:sulfonate transport system substrate-binding protein
VIRVAFPGVGVGNRPVQGGSVLATVQLQGRLEQEFKKDGINIEWSFLRGAGPAVNELYANGLLDFSTLGDLPSLVGRASGLSYHVLASGGVGGGSYIAVPSESPIQNVKDLRGKRVALFKGTAGQLSANKILATFGLNERDIKAINMDTNTSRNALITKDIDAAFGSADLLALRNQGAVRIIYTSRGGAPELTSNSLFLGSHAFVTKYPEITKRVMKVYLQVAREIADQDANPTKLLQLWTKSGTPFAAMKEDWQGQSVKFRTSPLLDPYVVSRYKFQLEQAKGFGLVRNSFDVEAWFDRSFLNAALKELGLENQWQPRLANGTYSSTQLAAATETRPATAQ